MLPTQGQWLQEVPLAAISVRLGFGSQGSMSTCWGPQAVHREAVPCWHRCCHRPSSCSCAPAFCMQGGFSSARK